VQLVAAAAVRRVHLEDHRRPVGGDRVGDLVPGQRAAAGRQVQVQPQWIDTQCAPVLPAQPCASPTPIAISCQLSPQIATIR